MAKILYLFLATVLLQGCLPIIAGAAGTGYYVGQEKYEHRGEPGGNIVADSHITYQVKNYIWGDKYTSGADISVETHGRVVTLTGTAPNASVAARAEQLARGAHGVVDVDNRLQILRY